MIDVTPLLRIYAGRRRARLASEDAIAAQKAQLLNLVQRAADTRFGVAHNFAAIRSIDTFQAQVPVRSYEEFWRDWWQPNFPLLADITWPGPIPFFAISSGTTTGTSKMIPVSPAMMRANERAALDILVHHVSHRRQSHVLGGRTFMVGGSAELKSEAPGIQSGDLSGIVAKRTPAWARWLTFPPLDIALMNDWDKKVDACIARMDAGSIRAITGTPSWLLVIFDRHAATRGVAPLARTLYPNLELIVHGAVNFTPYRDRFNAFLDGSHAETREVYPASEGFIALADEAPGDGLRLLVDNGLFYEFIPVDELGSKAPRRLWLADVEEGVNYAILITSNAGLWAYLLGDTVRFVSLTPPRLVVTGRTSYMMSAFGEHLIEEEVEDAVTGAARSIAADVTDFSLGAIYSTQPGELGGHLFIVEFRTQVDEPALAAFARHIDQRLSALNDDFRGHRADGFALAAPRIQVVLPGFFANWMKSRGKLGGQHKVPRMLNDPEKFAALRQYADNYRA